MGDAAQLLQHLIHSNSDTHYFWEDSLSVLDETVFNLRHMRGPKQISVLNLLGLCYRHKERLDTLNLGIDWLLPAIEDSGKGLL